MKLPVRSLHHSAFVPVENQPRVVELVYSERLRVLAEGQPESALGQPFLEEA